MSLFTKVDDENNGVEGGAENSVEGGAENSVEGGAENGEIVNEPKEKYEVVEFNDWEDLNLKKDLLRGIYSYGFEKPSPIQKKAIKPIFDRKDVIAQAQSGTGKTGAFCVGALQVLDMEQDKMQVLIIAPTRELSRQIHNVITNLGSVMKVKTQLVIGGTSTETDIKNIKKNSPQVMVGCPGRIYDLIRRKFINPKDIKLIVMDEADEMLSIGFKEQVYNILQYLNSDVQIGLFSATVPNEIRKLSSKFMRDPIEILVKAEALTLEGINQFYVALDDDHLKYITLKDLYGTISLSQCIIYCNSIRRVSDLYDAMKEDDYPVCAIHSNLTKAEREASYTDFKNGKYRVLISSNVTARGIDIQQVSTVINFDVPKDIHTYLHRIGRSGRWGRKGVGINFITRRDYRKIKEIEQYYHTEIKELPETFKS